jgi:hypothetical protein
MNRNTDPTQTDDIELLQALRRVQAAADATDALQQRVLTQWQQRHARACVEQPVLPSHGPALLLGLTYRQRLARGLLLLALALAATAWWLRPDPTLNELLQPDVLSQMALGEF